MGEREILRVNIKYDFVKIAASLRSSQSHSNPTVHRRDKKPLTLHSRYRVPQPSTTESLQHILLFAKMYCNKKYSTNYELNIFVHLSFEIPLFINKCMFYIIWRDFV